MKLSLLLLSSVTLSLLTAPALAGNPSPHPGTAAELSNEKTVATARAALNLAPLGTPALQVEA